MDYEKDLKPPELLFPKCSFQKVRCHQVAPPFIQKGLYESYRSAPLMKPTLRSKDSDVRFKVRSCRYEYRQTSNLQ